MALYLANVSMFVLLFAEKEAHQSSWGIKGTEEAVFSTSSEFDIVKMM